MTLYIPPFILGVIFTILAEIIACIIYAIVDKRKKAKKLEQLKRRMESPLSEAFEQAGEALEGLSSKYK